MKTKIVKIINLAIVSVVFFIPIYWASLKIVKSNDPGCDCGGQEVLDSFSPVFCGCVDSFKYFELANKVALFASVVLSLSLAILAIYLIKKNKEKNE